MARGSTGSGPRSGRVARSESPALRAILSQKSPAVRLVGNLVKSKALTEKNGRFVEGGDLPPTDELVKMANKELAEAERAMARASVEHSAIYDEDDNQIMVKTSHDSSAVYLSPKEMKAMKGKVFTHNHPIVDGVSLPFSRADVTLLHFTKAREFRAVAGETVFSISPPKDSKFWKMKESEVDKLLNVARTTAFLNLGYTEDTINRATTADLGRALDDMLKMVDRKLNIGYTKKTL